jgi:hypothetical protein
LSLRAERGVREVRQKFLPMFRFSFFPRLGSNNISQFIKGLFHDLHILADLMLN